MAHAVASQHDRTTTLAAAFLLVATAGLTAGCGGAADATPRAGATGTSSTRSTPRPTPTPSAAHDSTTLAYTVAPARFSGPAVAKFGPGLVNEAYREMAKFSVVTTFEWKPIATEPKDLRPADFATPKRWMTPSAAASWDREVSARHTDQGLADLAILDTLGATGDGYHLRTDVPDTFVDVRILEPKATLDTDGRLALTFRTKGEARATNPQGQPVKMHLNKVVTYWLTPGFKPGRWWVLDGWEGTFHGSKPSPDAR